MPVTLTLNAIRDQNPCVEGWTKLLSFLGKTKADDEPLLLSTVLESNGLDDASWCLRALPESMEGAIRLLACDFAERALRFVPEGEDRPRQAIEVARRYARGEATREEMDAAGVAAWAAARDAARDAARAAAWAAAGATAWATWAAAWAAARATAMAVAWAAERAAAAGEAERKAQTEIFRRWCETAV